MGDFFQSRPLVRIELDADHPVVNDVNIVVGPKGGTITGTVKDGRTGDLRSASFQAWRVQNPDQWVRFGCPPRRFSEVLPSLVEIALKVDSPGYETWYYTNEKIGKNSFKLCRPPKKERSKST